MEEAAKAAGLYRYAGQWRAPGIDCPVSLESPLVITGIAGWLRSQCVGQDLRDAYHLLAIRLDPRAYWSGADWIPEDHQIVCAMVALGHWEEPQAFMALGRPYPDGPGPFAPELPG